MNENATLAREPRTDPTGTIVDMTVDAMINAVTRAVPTGEATGIAVVRHPRTGTADIGEDTTAADREIPIEIESARVDGETMIAIDLGEEIEKQRNDTVTGQRLTKSENTQSLAVVPHVEIEALSVTAADVIINPPPGPPGPDHQHQTGKKDDGRGVTITHDLPTSQNTQLLPIQSTKLSINPSLRSSDVIGKNQTLLKICSVLFRLIQTGNLLQRFVRVVGAPTKLAQAISTPISPQTTILQLISSPMMTSHRQTSQLDAPLRAL